MCFCSSLSTFYADHCYANIYVYCELLACILYYCRMIKFYFLPFKEHGASYVVVRMYVLAGEQQSSDRENILYGHCAVQDVGATAGLSAVCADAGQCGAHLPMSC